MYTCTGSYVLLLYITVLMQTKIIKSTFLTFINIIIVAGIFGNVWEFDSFCFNVVLHLATGTSKSGKHKAVF